MKGRVAQVVASIHNERQRERFDEAFNIARQPSRGGRPQNPAADWFVYSFQAVATAAFRDHYQTRGHVTTAGWRLASQILSALPYARLRASTASLHRRAKLM